MTPSEKTPQSGAHPSHRDRSHVDRDSACEAAVRSRGLAGDDQILEARDLAVLCERHLGRRPSLIEVLFLRGELRVDQLRSVLHRSGVPIDQTQRMGVRKLFGRLVVELGYTTTEQLLRCLGIQERQVTTGEPPRPLGAIMVDEGVLTPEQLKEVLSAQRGMR